MKKLTNILCIGAGYVGGPTMAMIARKCPDRKVTVVDINAERIAAWQSDALPFYEPGLKEVVAETIGRNLFFSTDIPAAVAEADVVFVAVNTPTKTFGQGAGRAADLQYWEKTAREIQEYATHDLIVVEKSTLPVRTATAMKRVLESAGGKHRFEVLSNPEFLAEGTAIADLESPDRVLVGSDETPTGLAAREAVVDIYAQGVPRDRILTTNVWSSELSKLTANAFLAQRVSSINAISELCEATGADVDEVSRAIGMDSRIGPKFIKAGVGFGGSCFKKDILNLVYLCETYGLTQAAAYWRGVVAFNDHQQERFVSRILRAMFNTVAGKRVALFGFAFKADTGDTRESPAIAIARMLCEERASVVVTDPKALPAVARDLADCADRVTVEPDPYKAAEGADCIAVTTDWKVFRDLDYGRIYASMRKPAFLFDGRNLLDREALFKTGFNIYSVGRSPLTHLD